MRNQTFLGAPSAPDCFKYDLSKQALSVKKKILMCFCSVFIGVVNGLFGAGGGMLAVPCLTYIGQLDEKSAHATAIAAILPLCLVSAIVYALKESCQNEVILPVVIGVTAGGIFGALLLKKLSSDVVSFVFYALMTFAGFKMIFD